MAWTDAEVVVAIHAVVDKLTTKGVPTDKISSALAGIGIRLALESGINLETVHALVDDIHREI